MKKTSKPPIISVFGSKVGPAELKEIRESFQNQWLGIGPKTRAFETAFAKRLGLPGFALLNSGSNSLFTALKLLNLPAGSEVIVPSFTWIACAHAVILAGCKPVFCDVDVNTQNVTVETVSRHLTPKTSAIMVVHYAGKPVDIAPILELGLPVIEDAAHAVDSAIRGKPCGSFGHVGIFSFDSVKNLAMAEGGGITAQDSKLIERARLLRYCGIGKSGFEASAQKARWWEYQIVEFFPKFLPNDIEAGIGLAQLNNLDNLQKRRKAIWSSYQKELASFAWLKRPEEPAPHERHSYFTYFIRVLNGKRDALAKFLLDAGIYTTLRFHPLHLNPIYQSTHSLPISERLNEEGLNLPIHPRLTALDLGRIFTALKRFSTSVA